MEHVDFEAAVFVNALKTFNTLILHLSLTLCYGAVTNPGIEDWLNRILDHLFL